MELDNAIATPLYKQLEKLILDKITNSPARLVALGWMDAGGRNLYTKKIVKTPADLKGVDFVVANTLRLIHDHDGGVFISHRRLIHIDDGTAEFV